MIRLFFINYNALRPISINSVRYLVLSSSARASQFIKNAPIGGVFYKPVRVRNKNPARRSRSGSTMSQRVARRAQRTQVRANECRAGATHRACPSCPSQKFKPPLRWFLNFNLYFMNFLLFVIKYP